jgi:hypothetical protein
MNLKKIFCSIVLFISISYLTIAQNAPVNFTGWYGYEGYHPFTEGKPWGLMVEGYIKRNEVVVDPMQWFFRVGLNYQLKNGNRITGGYAYQLNLPYDEVSEPYNWSDHRIWEQFLIRKPFKKDKRGMFIQRFRLEQRWLQRKGGLDYSNTAFWKFENTFRYQFKVNIPINDKWSASFNDEIHLRFSSFDTEKLFDQNRIYAGLVYYVDKKREWRIEPGYMFQSTWNSADNLDGRKRINHAFRITITSDAPFKKHKN